MVYIQDFVFVVMTEAIEKPLLLSAEQTAALLGIGRTLFYAMQSNGKLGPMPVKLGARVLWRRDEIEKWVSANCPGAERWRIMQGKNND